MSDPNKTPTASSDLTVGDGARPVPGAIAVRAGVIDRVFALPPWAVVTLGIAVLLFILGNRYLKQIEPAQPVPVEIKVTQPAAPEELVAQGVAGKRLGPARRFFIDVTRKRLAERLEKDGFALIGKDPTPLTAAQAEQLVNRLSDDQVIQGAVESGAIGDGKILDRLSALVDWLIAHQDQLLKLLQFLMTLLAFI